MGNSSSTPYYEGVVSSQNTLPSHLHLDFLRGENKESVIKEILGCNDVGKILGVGGKDYSWGTRNLELSPDYNFVWMVCSNTSLNIIKLIIAAIAKEGGVPLLRAHFASDSRSEIRELFAEMLMRDGSECHVTELLDFFQTVGGSDFLLECISSPNTSKRTPLLWHVPSNLALPAIVKKVFELGGEETLKAELLSRREGKTLLSQFCSYSAPLELSQLCAALVFVESFRESYLRLSQHCIDTLSDLNITMNFPSSTQCQRYAKELFPSSSSRARYSSWFTTLCDAHRITDDDSERFTFDDSVITSLEENEIKDIDTFLDLNEEYLKEAGIPIGVRIRLLDLIHREKIRRPEEQREAKDAKVISDAIFEVKEENEGFKRARNEGGDDDISCRETHYSNFS